jgi:hypothetical protein
MNIFRELGEKVENVWAKDNYNERNFPNIAASIIEEMGIAKQIDMWEINRWIHKSRILPVQHDVNVKFSDLPITVFHSEGFYIDIYFWLNSSTTIHQHSFAGAFQVLHGSSLHSRYEFEKTKGVNLYLAFGKVSLQSFELLEKGQIRKILPGNEFIHSLFHLERPSVTLTVRTYGIPSAIPQFDYLKPSIAIDPFYKNDVIRKKTESVSLLLNMGHPETQNFICELLEDADLLTTYSILKLAVKGYCHHPLEKLFNVTKSQEKFDYLISVSRKKHGEIIDLFLPVFEEKMREDDIAKRRSQIKNHDHRFFMALLLNLSGRERIIETVKKRFPDDEPIAMIMSWVRELSMTKTFGAHEPNVLNIADFDNRKLFIFECLLKCMTVEQIESEIEKRYRNTDTEKNVSVICQELKNAPVFNSLFID